MSDASRFRFRAWVIADIDIGYGSDDGLLHKGWLKNQCEWFQMEPKGLELMWGFNEECEEPLRIGSDVLVEFSTGLTDESGVEIFEGDVVECPYVFDGARALSFNILGTVCTIDDEGSEESINTLMIRELSVIGNIHQNPKLLAKEKAKEKD